MQIHTKNNQQVYLRTLNANDLDGLLMYLQNLSDDTKKRFGPHAFDKQSVIDFYQNPEQVLGFVAEEVATQKIIAYAIVKLGYLEFEIHRFNAYGIVLNNNTDCVFAPSVADAWQSCGIGNQLFQFILTALRKINIQRIVLWGGVQADNERAVNYYKKHGFTTLGQFTYQGENFDMIYNL